MRQVALTLLLTAAGTSACATGSLDRTELNGVEELGHTARDVPVRGHDVVLVAGDQSVEGELLAVDDRCVWVDAWMEGILAIPRETIVRVRVQLHDTHSASYGGWTAAGALESGTHGWLAVFTLPLWLIAGTATAIAESASGRADASGRGLDALYQYARYPQGPPPALTRESPITVPPDTAASAPALGPIAPGAPAVVIPPAPLGYGAAGAAPTLP
jgi:hypothetical protein